VVDPVDHPWIRLTRYTLWFVAACYLLLGLGTGGLMPVMAFVDPELDGDPIAVGIFSGVGLFLFLFSAGFGALNLVAARGLARGAAWGWLLSIVLGGMYVTSACVPFGAVILIGLLQSDVREIYLSK
jgi:hypothetical protein